MLDRAEEVLDEMAPSVHGKITRNTFFSICLGRDDDEDPSRVKFLAQTIIVESFVGDQCANGDILEKRSGADAVMALTRQENEVRKVA
jgi:hypothetical protein